MIGQTLKLLTAGLIVTWFAAFGALAQDCGQTALS